MNILLILAFFLANFQPPAPAILIPENYTIGQSFEFRVTGLVANEPYELVANKEDQFHRAWQAKATFMADACGEINVASSIPLEGSYAQQDPYGLFWSMTMPQPPGEDWEAPEPKDYRTIEIALVKDRDTLEVVSTKQWIIPKSVEIESLNGDIVAEIIRPGGTDRPLPAILLLGGSGGGLSWAKRMGALLAAEGYVTMALAYFRAENLPQYLAQLPLEYVDQAISELGKLEYVDSDKIGILGYSKGAELALLTASRRGEIKSVAAIAPGSAVFQGFKPPKFPVLSSWTLEGEDLPFVPNAYDKRFFETYDGMYLWYRTLAQHEDFEKAAIPVEKINGDILLFSGIKDRIWPATFMAEQIISRLHIAEFEHETKHIALPYAGHGIAEPPGYPTASLSNRLGGTAYGNNRARAEVWSALKEFFDSCLK